MGAKSGSVMIIFAYMCRCVVGSRGIVQSVFVHLALCKGGTVSLDQIEKVAVILKEMEEGEKGLEV